MSAITLDLLQGVWFRNFIRWPDGRVDNTTRVWWIQAGGYFADLRIPPSRPDFQGINQLTGASANQRTWLASQQGFAGTLIQCGKAWQWLREIDFQPPTGRRDIGTLEFADADGNELMEHGVDEPYVEQWRRIDSAIYGQASVLRRPAGFLIAIGEHFLLAVDHRKVSPSLQEVDPLNMEISHGSRAGPIAQWTITDSTFPWREGEVVFPTTEIRIDPRAKTLTESAVWQIVPP